MSRCFPFPPGYEKKARTDGVDLLKKQKHTEKNNKKEKKNEEKREDKNRKEKEKSDEKHKDKKDRKGRSKEKKKVKDGDRTSTSQGKKTLAQVESCNGDHKFDHKERERAKDHNINSNVKKQSTPFCCHVEEKRVKKSLYNDGGMDKFVLDLCSRIKDEEKESASRSAEKNPFTGQTNHDRMVKKETGIISVYKGKKKDKITDIRKIGVQGVSVRAMVHNIAGKEKKEYNGVDIGRRFANKVEEAPRILEKSVESRDKNHKRLDIRMMDGQGISLGTAISVSTLQNITGKEKNGWFQNRVEEIPRILEKSTEPIENNHKKESEDKRGNKRKHKHKKKKRRGKDREREKEKKKEEQSKGGNEKKINNHDKAKDSIKNGLAIHQNIKLPPLGPDGGDGNLIHGQNTKLPPFLPDGDKNLIFGQNTKLPPLVSDDNRNLVLCQNRIVPPFVPGGEKNFIPDGDRNLILVEKTKLPPFVQNGGRNLVLGQNTKLPPSVLNGYRTPDIEGNMKKRKDIVANGFLHETKVVPNKKPRPTPHPSKENGRKLEPCQNLVKVPAPSNLVKVNNNEHNVNGKIELQPLSISSKKPSSLSSSPSSKPKAGHAQASKVKPPHPDTNYLSKVLLVPKNEHNVNGKIEVQPLSISLKKPPSSSPSSSSKTKPDQLDLAPKVMPPHPDTKYLSEVLLVPKIEELCEFNDEEWFFSSKNHVSVSSGPTKASETPMVWAKAVQIEWGDVCALPYVIPY